ncbi:MAG TPA: hypothetical protein VNC50_18550 [Planctomycetia bacterium]|nr:hypothetical protein [Planctomycetia bacterium]
MLAPLLVAGGCHGRPILAENPTLVPDPKPGGYEQVWNTTVEVVDRYFDIASEDRYSGKIETLPETGSSLLEPWRPDSVDFYERLESSLQTIRRRGFVRVQPAPAGGYLVNVEVYKELEDLHQPIFTNFGGGTLVTSIMPLREQVFDQDVPAGAGWISLGRDLKLEGEILAELRSALGCGTIAGQP